MGENLTPIFLNPFAIILYENRSKSCHFKIPKLSPPIYSMWKALFIMIIWAASALICLSGIALCDEAIVTVPLILFATIILSYFVAVN